MDELRNYSIILTKLLEKNQDSTNLMAIKDNCKQIKYELNKVIQKEVFGTGDLVKEFLELNECIITYKIDDINSITKIIGEMKSCIELMIAYETYNRRDNLSAYIRRVI